MLPVQTLSKCIMRPRGIGIINLASLDLVQNCILIILIITNQKRKFCDHVVYTKISYKTYLYPLFFFEPRILH